MFHMYKPLVVIAETWHNFPMGNKSYYVLYYNDTMKAYLICGDCTSNNCFYRANKANASPGPAKVDSNDF